MSPAFVVPRSAPGWLRLLVLAGVGLVLLSPLIRVGYLNRGRNRPARARETAERFLEALLQDNPHELERLLPPQVVDAFTSRGATNEVLREGRLRAFGQFVLGLGSPAIQGGIARVPFTAEIGIPEIQGTIARVPFILRQQGQATIVLTDVTGFAIEQRKKMFDSAAVWAKKQDGTRGVLLLVWEENGWLVTGMIRPADDRGQGREIAFIQVVKRQPAATEVAAFAALTTTDAAAFDKAWREDLTVRNEPAGKLLHRLANEAGFVFALPSLRREIVAREVAQFARQTGKMPALIHQPLPAWERKLITLTFQGRSRLEIIDRIARQAEIELVQADRTARQAEIGLGSRR